MKRFFTLASALFIAAATIAQTASVQPVIPVIPNDPAVRKGTLENGMTYYIRHNDKQKNLADFYIVHDVGAIQENDSQQGLAHFLEHMAFNGTKNLPGKMLIEYLEKVGVKFGANLNASTSWDVTQYLMRDVPTVREGIVDSALLVLHDWSNFIALESKEIDSERGVIMEELRTRDNAQWRSMVQFLKALTKGTKYEHRNLIGYLDGLKSFDHSDIEDFYNTWYRPDYQAVVVVGDIDVDKVENKIKTLMADIPASPADAPQKEVIVVPDNKEPIISIFTDPEMLESSAAIYCKHEAMPKDMNNTILYEKVSLINSLGSAMANARLNEIAMKPNAPFTSAYMFNGGIGICPTLETLVISVNTKDGGLAAGLEAAYTELKRIREHGFTDGEFERAQNDVLRREERAYTNRNDRKNQEYVSRYISNFRRNTPIPDAETEWKLDSVLIKTISLAEVNQLFKNYIHDDNQVISIEAPIKEGVANPTEEDVKAIIAKVNAATVEAYADNTVKEPLIANEKALKGSPVKKTAVNEILGTTEWTLKNGIKVIVKPTTFKADEVIVNIRSHAGMSALSDEDYPTASFFYNIVSNQGVSKFSATDLKKQLSGKSARVVMMPTDFMTQMVGSGSPKDLETLLQLQYLYFTEPRFNKDDFDVTINQFRSYVENLKTSPDYIASKELTKTLYGDHPRKQTMSPELLDKISFDRLPAVYKQLYSNAKNFTVTIVGNVDLATLKPLVEKYIGSLPVTKDKLARVDDGVRPVKGVAINDFKAPMQQPKVGVYRVFTGEIPYTLENQVAMTFLSQALSSRYLISIREEKGGTYGVGVRGNIRPDFEGNYMLNIIFDTNEEMADELSEIVMDELKKIAEEGPLTEDVEKTRQFLLKNWKNQIEDNQSWQNFIDGYYYRGIDQISNYENVVTNLTNADVQALAKKILEDNNMTYVVMRPEK